MKLEDSERMFFDLDGKKQNVEIAPPEVFDAFISEVVEDIKNVDRAKWPIFQRWRIINACLPEDVLLLEERPDGSLLLSLPEASDSPVNMPELQTSGSSS